MSARLNLRRLMWAGYNGGSVLKGADPQRVIVALQQRFDVVVVTLMQGPLNFELCCYDQNERQRLKVRYGWMGNGWQYEPVAVRQRQRRPRRNPGDVVYRPDGSYTVAA